MGAELTVGFTVTGCCDRPVTKRGAQAGDALILTKPLGTGIILAAEMQITRPKSGLLGPVWANCVANMARPMGRDAAILAPVARAMSDCHRLWAGRAFGRDAGRGGLTGNA